MWCMGNSRPNAEMCVCAMFRSVRHIAQHPHVITASSAELPVRARRQQRASHHMATLQYHTMCLLHVIDAVCVSLRTHTLGAAAH